MAEVQGTPEPKGHGVGGFMHNTTAGMPNWVWLLVIGGGIVLAIGVKYYMGKKKPAGNATTTGTTPDSGLSLAIDPTTGLPYAVEGLVPAGGTTGGTPIIQPAPGPPGPPGTPGTPGTNMVATVRARFSQPAVKAWDTNTPAGVPIRSSPQDLQGQNIIGYAPYGGSLSIVGAPVTGTTNVLGQAGSSIWYKLASGGYISQFDIGNINAADAGHSGPPSTTEQFPSWPGDSVSRTRIYG